MVLSLHLLNGDFHVMTISIIVTDAIGPRIDYR